MAFPLSQLRVAAYIRPRDWRDDLQYIADGLEEWAFAERLPITGWYEDRVPMAGDSAGITPVGESLLLDIEAGLWDVVICDAYPQLVRDSDQFLRLWAAITSTDTHLVDQVGLVDTRTPFGAEALHARYLMTAQRRGESTTWVPFSPFRELGAPGGWLQDLCKMWVRVWQREKVVVA